MDIENETTKEEIRWTNQFTTPPLTSRSGSEKEAQPTNHPRPPIIVDMAYLCRSEASSVLPCTALGSLSFVRKTAPAPICQEYWGRATCRPQYHEYAKEFAVERKPTALVLASRCGASLSGRVVRGKLKDVLHLQSRGIIAAPATATRINPSVNGATRPPESQKIGARAEWAVRIEKG